ncbi:WD40/YVTN/BNR-like repeat-containing protein [Bizionia sp. KMM 8389]
MKYLSFLLIVSCFLGCKTENETLINPFVSVSEQAVLNDSTLSIRALEILDSKSLAFAANNNTYGLYNMATDTWQISKIEHDSLELEFRAISNNSEDFFMLNVGNPALLFKTTNTGDMKVVYKEVHDKVFYDAMTFWNREEGIAIGDATSDCLSILITRNAGESWEKIPCKNLPSKTYGAAAFAASNTNIVVKGNHAWVATGGMVSSILYTADKGHTWEVVETPIIQGKETTGIYSVDFYNEANGFAIGGDYTDPDVNVANKMRTTDGGKTWSLVAVNQNPGYRSCVQYVPNSDGRGLVAVGFEGVDYSNDNGSTWTHFSDESYYTIRFLNDSIAYAAGSGGVSKLKFNR